MNCIVHTGGIVRIEYIPIEDVSRVRHNWPTENRVVGIDLKPGKAWTVLDFIPETASLNLNSDTSTIHSHSYELPFQPGGVSTDSLILITNLGIGRYLVKLWDTNWNTWLLGTQKSGGRFLFSSGNIGQTLPDDNVITCQFNIIDRIPMLKVA